MRTIGYKQADMIFQAVGCLAMAAGCAWLFASVGGIELKVLFGLLAATLPVAAGALLFRALGDHAALRFDDRTLQVRTLFGGASLPWAQVGGIYRETLRQSHMFGLIKQDVGHYLVVEAHDAQMNARRFKLNERLLDHPRSAIPTLIDDMMRAQSGAPRPAPPPRAGSDRSEASDFDADAALARYLARRDASEGADQPQSARRPAFGRKGA